MSKFSPEQIQQSNNTLYQLSRGVDPFISEAVRALRDTRALVQARCNRDLYLSASSWTDANRDGVVQRSEVGGVVTGTEFTIKANGNNSSINAKLDRPDQAYTNLIKVSGDCFDGDLSVEVVARPPRGADVGPASGKFELKEGQPELRVAYLPALVVSSQATPTSERVAQAKPQPAPKVEAQPAPTPVVLIPPPAPTPIILQAPTPVVIILTPGREVPTPRVERQPDGWGWTVAGFLGGAAIVTGVSLLAAAALGYMSRDRLINYFRNTRAQGPIGRDGTTYTSPDGITRPLLERQPDGSIPFSFMAEGNLDSETGRVDINQMFVPVTSRVDATIDPATGGIRGGVYGPMIPEPEIDPATGGIRGGTYGPEVPSP